MDPAAWDARTWSTTAAFTGRPGFDPAPYLSKTQVPTLWLLGDRDLSVPTAASVRALDAMRVAGNTSHTVVRYATADHSLRNVETGRPVPLWDDTLRWLAQQGIVPAPR